MYRDICTLKFVKTLEAGGFERIQAEGVAIAFRDAFIEQRVVRDRRLRLDAAKAKAEFVMLNWLLGLSVCGVAILVLRAFSS